MTKLLTPHAEALAVARELILRLAPVCERIAIAGSLRRQQSEVGDIELVAIPRYDHARDLFGAIIGQPINLVSAALSEWGVPRTKNGPAYQQFGFLGQSVDLFMVTAETWGVQYAIRTGSADFSHWLVTQQRLGGALPEGMWIEHGRLWRRRDITAADRLAPVQISGHAPEALPTPEEADLFRAIGLACIPSAQRTHGHWAR